MALYMGLDVGGTFVKGIIIDENGKLICEDSIPTVTGEGLADCIEALAETLVRHSGLMFSAIEGAGVGCPGLIDSAEGKVIFAGNMRLKDYPLQKLLQDKLGITVKICNDANAAALGESFCGAGTNYKNSVLVTLGTGVGGGIYIDGKLLHGMLHPEAGHVLIRKRSDDAYEGKCPYHKTCLEGLAAGPAIEARWGQKAVELKDRPEVWDLEADYIAQALVGYILTLSPEMIILGGGVMHQEQLFPLIREKVTQMLGGYIQTEELADMEHYIVPASLHDDQGIMGCLELARREKAGCV